MQDKFLETSVIVCATTPQNSYSDIVFGIVNEGNFYICCVVFEEITKLAQRRGKIYQKILSNPIQFREKPLGEVIKEIINKTDVMDYNDNKLIIEIFNDILVSLNFNEQKVLSEIELKQFELCVNKRFHEMINRFMALLYKFEDPSYFSLHVVPKYTSKKYIKLFRSFFNAVKAKSREEKDIKIITNASHFSHENNIFLYFISNDPVHTNNTKIYYEILKKAHNLTLDEELLIQIMPITYLNN